MHLDLSYNIEYDKYELSYDNNINELQKETSLIQSGGVRRDEEATATPVSWKVPA